VPRATESRLVHLTKLVSFTPFVRCSTSRNFASGGIARQADAVESVPSSILQRPPGVWGKFCGKARTLTV